MNASLFPRILSASGVPLAGSKIVRVVYLDESGTSPRQKVLAVVGIIIHGDSQIIPIEEYLESLIEKHIPEKHRNGFFFHATDIYHGGKNDCIFHDKAEWPDERRWAILDDLASIPAKFDLPICVSLSPKDEILDADAISGLNATKQQVAVAQHTLAIIQCEAVAEMWMRQHAKDEVALITAENHDEVRLAAKGAHLTIKDRALMDAFGLDGHPFFPLKHIKDGLQFADKAECRMLQVADVCAWAIRRTGEGAADAERWYVPMMKQIILSEIADAVAS